LYLFVFILHDPLTSDKIFNPDISLGGAERLHESCRMLSGIFLPVFLTNSYGYCFVKRTKNCS